MSTPASTSSWCGTPVYETKMAVGEMTPNAGTYICLPSHSLGAEREVKASSIRLRTDSYGRRKHTKFLGRSGLGHSWPPRANARSAAFTASLLISEYVMTEEECPGS